MTDTDIINRALMKLGQDGICSLSDDNERAKAAAAAYDAVRDSEIASYRWCFAARRALIEECEEKPPFGFARQFALPDDFLRLIALPDAPDNAADDYAIEGLHLLTDYPSPLKILYIARIVSPQFFPPVFAEALACRLAAELCERLTQDAQRKQLLMAEYAQTISTAKRCSAIQMAAQRPPEGIFIEARRGII